jgi:aminopeptidase
MMSDPRVSKLAQILVNYSTKVQKGDKVLIRGYPLEPVGAPIVMEVFREILKAGGHPHLLMDLEDIRYYFYNEASDTQLLTPNMLVKHAVENMDVDIRISAQSNMHYLEGIDPAKYRLVDEAYAQLTELWWSRFGSGELRWVATRFPCQSYADAAEMSFPDYEDFYYGTTYVNEEDPIRKYEEMEEAQAKLIAWLRNREQVHIEGEGIDLTMSIKGRSFINCCGILNIPDGEICTSPVEESVNGKIKLSYPCIYAGKEVEGVELEFANGEVTKATSEKNEDYLLETLKTDDGARFVGELGIGTNFEINRFTKNMLFDEKLGGTIHIALGNGIPGTGSKNTSRIHWDLLADMTNGRIVIDGDLFYEKGHFTV